MWTIERNGSKGWEVCWEMWSTLYAATEEFKQRISEDPGVQYRLTGPEFVQ